jgi:MPBQ/MSBQ methyltransferase
MTGDRLHDRIIDQFSYRGEHADIWKAFDRVIEADAFLNLGYSTWYQPHILGSSQRRLAAKIATELVPCLSDRADGRLLDIGCGRGGPTIEMAETLDLTVTGVDLVPFNVAMARANSMDSRISAEFLVGDAARLPIATASVASCTAIDSIVYVPNKITAFEELARVLEDDGVLALSDLLVSDEASQDGMDAVTDFAEAWDMPPLTTVGQYLTDLDNAGFSIKNVQDITANSVGRFHTWTTLYLMLDVYARNFVKWLFARWDIDRQAITEQIRCAHRALPHLKHLLVHATHL